MDDAAILVAFERIALRAGAAVMEARRHGFQVEAKQDRSPVTRADRDSEQIILDGLAAALPEIPVVAEEQASCGKLPSELGSEFLLVDPLDGTREFVGGRDEFTVNIALVRGGRPEIGVVYAPARRALYCGRPGAAFACTTSDAHAIRDRRQVRVRQAPPVRLLLVSRSHRTARTDEFLAGLGPTQTAAMGSSLKFCLIAAGEADLYPRLEPTMQWDTAAGDAVLRAAGGSTCTPDGKSLRYGRGEEPGVAAYRNPSFIASGAPTAL